MGLSLPLLFPCCHIPHFNNAIAAAGCKMFEAIRVLGKTVNAVDLDARDKNQHGSGMYGSGIGVVHTCPGSKSPRNGCANMRSSFVAFKARVYSRARSKGCWVGSRFLVSLLTLEPGAWADEAGLESALIFIFRRCEQSGGCAPGAPWGSMRASVPLELQFVPIPKESGTSRGHQRIGVLLSRLCGERNFRKVVLARLSSGARR